MSSFDPEFFNVAFGLLKTGKTVFETSRRSESSTSTKKKPVRNYIRYDDEEYDDAVDRAWRNFYRSNGV